MKPLYIATLALALSATEINAQSHFFTQHKEVLDNAVKQENIEDKAAQTVMNSLTKTLSGQEFNPLVSLASTQLGIPSKYLPQIQSLYNLYKNKGTLVSSDIISMTNLMNWLNSTNALSPESLATNLNTIFGKS